MHLTLDPLGSARGPAAPRPPPPPPPPPLQQKCARAAAPRDGGSSYQMEFLISCCSALASVPGSPGTRAGRATPGLGVLGGGC